MFVDYAHSIDYHHFVWKHHILLSLQFSADILTPVDRYDYRQGSTKVKYFQGLLPSLIVIIKRQ